MLGASLHFRRSATCCTVDPLQAVEVRCSGRVPSNAVQLGELVTTGHVCGA